MMSVIPTLLRRLETDWRRIPVGVGDSEYDLRTDYVPLPDFIPPRYLAILHCQRCALFHRLAETPP